MKRSPSILFRDVPEEYLKAKAALICPMILKFRFQQMRAFHNKGKFFNADLED